MENYISQIWSWLGNNSAETIAASALFFTAYQAIVTRRHNRISVRPHLSESTIRNLKPKEGVLSFIVSNNGLGPAVIKGWKVLLDKVDLKMTEHDSVEDVIRHLINGRNFNFSIGTLGEGYVMPSNESKNVLTIHFEVENDDDFNNVESSLNSLDLIVKYESMYGETFTLDTRGNDS